MQATYVARPDHQVAVIADVGQPESRPLSQLVGTDVQTNVQAVESNDAA